MSQKDVHVLVRLIFQVNTSKTKDFPLYMVLHAPAGTRSKTTAKQMARTSEKIGVTAITHGAMWMPPANTLSQPYFSKILSTQTRSLILQLLVKILVLAWDPKIYQLNTLPKMVTLKDTVHLALLGIQESIIVKKKENILEGISAQNHTFGAMFPLPVNQEQKLYFSKTLSMPTL
jgi:hypothetical protein